MKLSNRRCVKGFTLLEVLIATAILAFCLCGLLATYVNMFFLTSLLRDSTLATSAVQAKLEEVRNTGFACTSSEFTLDGIVDGKGVVQVSLVAGNPTLKKVRIIACFRSRGRVIGNDIETCSSSPFEAVTYVAE
jgi:type II secretion system protein I